ncbi:Six-hairpin glycosidase-like protein [Hyaloraphidium curvatum]|nr:Six-hairpin glycosidase-like protein [Hyaloraphidium curvatum]
MDGPEAGDHAHCGNPRHAKHCSHESSSPRGYLPIESYGVIGNCHTAALIGTDGSLDYLCWPDFDSPTVFCRLLDSRKGGHFSITPIGALTSKSRSGPTGHSVEAAGHAVDLDADGYKFRGEQHYHPMTNVLITRSINENGDVVRLTDFAVPLTKDRPANKKFPWIIREIECIRGAADVKVECFPAFDYARASHAVDIEHIPQQRRSSVSTASPGDDLLENPYSPTHQRSAVRTATEVCPNRVRFTSAGGGPSFDIRSVLSYDAIYREQLKGRAGADGDEAQLEALCEIQWKVADSADHLGPGAVAVLSMREGQRVSLVFREVPGQDGHRRPEPVLTGELVELLQKDTVAYWKDWLSKSNYKGRYRELVHRSALVLKMLCYEPTGAIVASPTFGLPEHIGGTRNWDYRYCWIRDASFLIYALVRLGLTTEAWNYKEFIASCSSNFPNDGSSPLKIMYTIRGSTDLPEIELEHLEGYHGSRPVRIGNAAVTHLQLDIYGALLDAAYLFDKYHEPIGYDFWLVLRVLTDWLCDNWNTVDQSVWEVRAGTHHFTYSRLMSWVALDRAIRFASKRSNLPCPQRGRWIAERDRIYETVMDSSYSADKACFVMSAETAEEGVLDASCLMMPLVFFIGPTDPRMLNTIRRIMRPPELGGLTVNGLVYRYDPSVFDDGVGGEEGTFTMCSLWLVECLARAGGYHAEYKDTANVLFEQILTLASPLWLYSEEVSRSGEALGNFPQAFTHTALVSAAFNLDRMMGS